MISSYTPRKLSLTDIKKVHSMLKDDFHSAEIKPWIWLLVNTLKGCYDGYALFDGENIAAYALFYNDKSTGLSLLDYLAVRSAYRAQGAGAKFLQELVKLKPEMVLETENPEYAVDEADRDIRVRRLGFYHRNGFEETGLLVRLFGEDYRVLQYGGSGRAAVTKDEMEALYAGMFRQGVAKRFSAVTMER